MILQQLEPKIVMQCSYNIIVKFYYYVLINNINNANNGTVQTFSVQFTANNSAINKQR